MTYASRHKHKGSPLGGEAWGGLNDPTRAAVVGDILPVGREVVEADGDPEFSELRHDSTRERSVVVADGPHDGLIEAPSAEKSTKENQDTELPAAARSNDSLRDEPAPRSRNRISDSSDAMVEQAVPQRARSDDAPRSSATPRKRTDLRVSHEDGGGGSSGSSPTKQRSRVGFSRRARGVKNSGFDSLVVPDESILDYLVSTVARWLERLRDSLLRRVTPPRNQPKPAQRGDGKTDDNSLLVGGATGTLRSASGRKNQSRERSARRSQ